MARFWSSQTWVMPTFSPTIAFVATAGSFFSNGGPAASHAHAPPGQIPSGALSSVVPRGFQTSDTRGRRLAGSGSISHRNCPVPNGPVTVRRMVDHAPPPVPLGGNTAVPIDIEAVNAQIAFDPLNRRASAAASVVFTVGADAGCPVLDLRQPVGAATLAGSSLPVDALAHHDLDGGVGAEMRVLGRSLAAGSRHEMQLRYQLATPAATDAQPVGWDDERAAVRFDFWMSDLHPGRYLEMWLPANLCHDRFALTVDLTVATDVPHTVVTNGEVQELSAGRWRISYPDHFTSLSPMLVIAPAGDLMIRSRPVRLAGRTEPVEVVTAAPTETGADLAA